MLTKLEKHLLILCAFAFFATGAGAQDHVPAKWYGVLQSGIVFEKIKVNIQPAIAGGREWKGYGVGLSAGMDMFSVRSIQAYMDLRKSFDLGKHRWVVFAAPGLNLVIPTKKEKEPYSSYEDHRFRNGNYLETGGGILMGKKKNLLAAFYWSRKTYEETYKNFLWNPDKQRLEEYQARNKYTFSRLGVKIGFRF